MTLEKIIIKASNIKPGNIYLPGSKSITNRILLLASLSWGETKISNMLFSDDTMIMISSLQKLGIDISFNESDKTCFVQGSSNFFPNKNLELYLGNAGTAMRPLTAVLAFNNGNYLLHGTSRMHERPIGDLVNSLNEIGANIEYTLSNGFPPLKIKDVECNIKNKISIKGNISSQFLTSLLIASPIINKNKNKLEIEVIGNLISKPYVDITLELMKKFSLEVNSKSKNNFTVEPGQVYKSPGNINVEGDASSASYFMAASAISGKLLKIHGVGKHSIQGDIKFINVLEQMGAKIKYGQNFIEVSSSSQLTSIDIDLNHIPDAAMTLAILALYAKGTSTLKNIGSWRVKETDRLNAMAKELRKLGATIIEGEDFIKITPPANLRDAIIDTYDDHRMAMCFSLVAINSKYIDGCNITINDPNCVSKTFPNYFDIFNSILD
jgi:3-phosphoshikimate 1-carboxyvinyltransferase